MHFNYIMPVLSVFGILKLEYNFREPIVYHVKLKMKYMDILNGSQCTTLIWGRHFAELQTEKDRIWRRLSILSSQLGISHEVNT